MAKSFGEYLLVGAQIILVVAIIAFAVTSFFTTFNGFQSFLFWEAALVAALGLQLTLTATGLFFAHTNTFKQRITAFGSFLFALILSVTFSYIGLRKEFSKNVEEKRNPIYESNEFRAKRDQLNNDALKIKGAALSYFDNADLDIQSNSEIATKNADARKLIADKLRNQIKAAESRGANKYEINRLRRQLTTAEANRDSLAVETTRLNKEIGQVAKRRENITAYQPNILSLTDKNWAGLQTEHNKLAALWGEMPEEFRAANPLPPAPTKSVLKENSQLAGGQDHPTIEALKSIESPEPHEKFAVGLALLLDLVPFVAVLMTRGKRKPFYRRLAELRRWMRETRVQIELMDGIFGWIWKIVVGFFFRRAITNDDPRVVAFRRFLEKLRAEMEDFLQNSALPDGIAELLRVRLTKLYSQSEEIAFDASTRLNETVLTTYESCLDEIDSDGLDENTKIQLRDFLNRHMEKFDAAVRSANFSETANGNNTRRSQI